MDQFEGEVSSVPIEYEPVNVKDVLVEMRDTAELMIDISYSAVLFSNTDLAHEVLKLEERMDTLKMRARMGLMMAVRNPEDAEQLAPVLGIVDAADSISDAAGDIAKVVIEDIGLPDAMRAALPDAVETLVRTVIEPSSSYVSEPVSGIETDGGIRTIALRRGDEWFIDPADDTTVEGEDVLLLRGAEANIDAIYQNLTGTDYEPPKAESSDIEDLERAVDTIVHMKNLSELAVDLAYSAVLFDDESLAMEVRNLEVEVDALESRFEAWTLRAAASASDPIVLRGMIHLGKSTEVISDAALDISEGVIRDIEAHPVIKMAVEESEEIIVRHEIDAESDLDGVTVADGVPDIDLGVSIIAVRRPDEGWLLVGDAEMTLQANDVVIAMGRSEAIEDVTRFATA